MTADDYSLCITHVLIFINKELVPHVHAKMTGLFTTTTPASQVFVFGFCSLKKKKRLSFQFQETEKIRLLAVCESFPPVLSEDTLSAVCI